MAENTVQHNVSAPSQPADDAATVAARAGAESVRAVFEANQAPGSAAPASPASMAASRAEEALLEMQLDTAGIPESCRELVRREFRRTHDLPSAAEQIGALRNALADAAAPRVVQGLGRVSGVLTPLDRITLGFERLMGMPEEANRAGVEKLSGIREMYDLLTGDHERIGRFQPQNVRFANATTTTMAEIVRNVLNKVMLRHYEASPQWWKPIVWEEDLPNMQDARWLTVGGFSDLSTVSEGSAYTEKSWDDYAETSSFVKKGNYLGLTLEMIDKDDVGAVRSLPRRLAHAAQRTLSSAVAAVFTANSGVGPTLADTNPLFDATHSNLLTTALSADAWDAAIQAMFKQTEYSSSKRLGIRPRYCLVPIELEKTGLTIFTSDLEPGTDHNDANVRRSSSSLITVPDFTDANDWAAVADPAELPGICVGYRFGRAPELFIAGDELMGSMFTNDEMRIKVRFVYTVGVADYRALHKNNVSS